MSKHERKQILLHDFFTPAFSASVIDTRTGGDRQNKIENSAAPRQSVLPPSTRRATALPVPQSLARSSRTILVADDDAAVRDSLSRALACENYQVVTASNGADAVEMFRKEPVDLVLLDLSMPQQNGWEAFERMSACAPRVPVVIITGHEGQHENACAAGAGALLEKPIHLPALLDTIQELLREADRPAARSGYGNPPRCRYHQSDRSRSAVQLKARWRIPDELNEAPLTGGINE